MLTMARRAQPNKALVSERIQKLIKLLSNGVYEREGNHQVVPACRIIR